MRVNTIGTAPCPRIIRGDEQHAPRHLAEEAPWHCPRRGGEGVEGRKEGALGKEGAGSSVANGKEGERGRRRMQFFITDIGSQ